MMPVAKCRGGAKKDSRRFNFDWQYIDGNTKQYIAENEYQHVGENTENRKAIYEWSEKRRRELQGCRLSYRHFLLHTFRLNILISFLRNFNYMVVMHMIFAASTIYIFQTFHMGFEMNVMIFVSPIVFPLAFSINIDFQRRERVLNDLAFFKSSSMSLFFSMRDWNKSSTLYTTNWFTSVHFKIKSLLFHLKEYLLTEKSRRRQFILQAMYEDFSDLNQLFETFRTSNLTITNGLIPGPIYSLKELILAFERIRNVREYQSPRSIRSFTKCFIFLMPLIFAPYFVYLGEKVSDRMTWPPYFLAILTSFVFGALQGVQDKLDDPFNGMSEDDLNINSIDDWALQSLDSTVNRTYNVGRFHVTSKPDDYSKDFSQNPKEKKISGQGSCSDRKLNDETKYFVSQKDEKHVTKRNSFKEKYANLLKQSPGDMLIKQSLPPFSKVKYLNKHQLSRDEIENLQDFPEKAVESYSCDISCNQTEDEEAFLFKGDENYAKENLLTNKVMFQSFTDNYFHPNKTLSLPVLSAQIENCLGSIQSKSTTIL